MENMGNGVKAANRTMQLRVLLSYHYYRDTDLFELFNRYFAKPWPDVFLDSGAFSAKTQGAEIDIGAYAEWLKHHESLATVYANLDVIGNAEGTARNQRDLERLGLRPLPVFHTGEPWITLEDLCAEYQYIALGGMVGVRDKKALNAWIAKCFSIAGDRAVFHGFGLTAWGLMKAFRWYSVDSSSWGTGFRYGALSLFDENAGKFVKLNLRDKAGAWNARRLIESYGFAMSDFAIHEQYDRAKVCAISALSYMRAETFLRRLHGEVTIPEQGSFQADTERRTGLPRGCEPVAPEPGIRQYASVSGLPEASGGTTLHNLADSLGLRSYLADSMGAGGGDLQALGSISLRIKRS